MGLPDALRFWKTRIEVTDPDKTFRVGMIYGPSGCGKSSLIKAGLIPRLAKPVLSVYVESTAAETESRLLRGVHKTCPELPESLDLAGSLARLRQGRLLHPGQKVLLVLDQFEQWLFERRDAADTELLAALRQCDGEHTQAIVPRARRLLDGGDPVHERRSRSTWFPTGTSPPSTCSTRGTPGKSWRPSGELTAPYPRRRATYPGSRRRSSIKLSPG